MSRRYEISKLITKEHKLLLVLGISILFAIIILKWANEDSPVYRPLIQDMRLVDSVKIADVLDQERVNYYADVKKPYALRKSRTIRACSCFISQDRYRY